jgi:hypothetical protein
MRLSLRDGKAGFLSRSSSMANTAMTIAVYMISVVALPKNIFSENLSMRKTASCVPITANINALKTVLQSLFIWNILSLSRQLNYITKSRAFQVPAEKSHDTQYKRD